MRTIAIALLLLAFVGAASAAIPATCADPCAISGASTGYVPPIVTIASGTSVTWVGTDGTGHITLDGTSGPTGGTCVAAPFTQGIDSPPVTFLAIGDTLTTTSSDGEISTCTTATELPGATGFVLPYVCGIHPSMRGVIVVSG